MQPCVYRNNPFRRLRPAFVAGEQCLPMGVPSMMPAIDSSQGDRAPSSFDERTLNQLADLIAGNDPCLSKLYLDADGRFQTRSMSSDGAAREVVAQLRAVFDRTDPNDLPHLYYGCGRARSGSTALTNVFGMAGIPSYYQPVKSVLRHVLNQSQAPAWDIGAESKHIFAKETFGPYTLAECLFQPLDMLMAAGYPADKIDLIAFDREPMSALASWLAKWSGRLPAEQLAFHFVLAGLNVQRLMRGARAHGIRTTTYVYELSKAPVFAVGRLFDRLAIPSLFNAAVVTDWRDSGDLGSESSSIIFPDEPDVFDVPGLHSSDVAYRFHARAAAEVPRPYRMFLEEMHADASYRASIQSCISDLEIGPARAEAIFGPEGLDATPAARTAVH